MHKINLKPKKINKKALVIIPVVAILFILSFFVIPFKNGRSIFANISYSQSKAAAILPSNYDKMKITYATIKTRITGLPNFDTPDGQSVDDGSILSDMVGHDVSAVDNYVRTHDAFKYTIEVGIDRNEYTTDPNESITGGIIKFRITVPEPPSASTVTTMLLIWLLAAMVTTTF